MENDNAPEEKKPESEVKPPEILIESAETGHAMPGVHLISKKRWFIVGIVIAILNPLISGLLFGIVLWKEPEMQREGKIVTGISIAWGVLATILVKVLKDAGY